jgi:hypothetical protein
MEGVVEDAVARPPPSMHQGGPCAIERLVGKGIVEHLVGMGAVEHAEPSAEHASEKTSSSTYPGRAPPSTRVRSAEQHIWEAAATKCGEQAKTLASAVAEIRPSA